mmetsp:Transcript_91129/g.195432  ORF Transcript_91129/g.195432 Transcript_91129/m.195432 type:complete len:236 (+) Transcript_91129:1145-1852(+)
MLLLEQLLLPPVGAYQVGQNPLLVPGLLAIALELFHLASQSVQLLIARVRARRALPRTSIDRRLLRRWPLIALLMTLLAIRLHPLPWARLWQRLDHGIRGVCHERRPCRCWRRSRLCRRPSHRHRGLLLLDALPVGDTIRRRRRQGQAKGRHRLRRPRYPRRRHPSSRRLASTEAAPRPKLHGAGHPAGRRGRPDGDVHGAPRHWRHRAPAAALSTARAGVRRGSHPLHGVDSRT